MAAVWNGMDQQELDRQYSPSKWSKRLSADKIVGIHFSYLAEECSEPPAILMFIHGGGWSEGGIEHVGYLALPLAPQGVAVVAVGYDLAPKVTMTTIVEQCRKACAFVAKKFPKSKLFVGGHSAGGHLSACMLYTDWSQYGLETQPLSGAIMLSGLYELEPIQKSYINKDVHLSESEVKEQSPQRKLELIKKTLPAQFPCLIAVGEDEPDEFRRQGEEFHQGLLSVGVASINMVVAGKDHFDLVENMTDASCEMAQSIIHFITSNTRS